MLAPRPLPLDEILPDINAAIERMERDNKLILNLMQKDSRYVQDKKINAYINLANILESQLQQTYFLSTALLELSTTLQDIKPILPRESTNADHLT